MSLRSRFLVVFLMIFLGGAATAYGVIASFNQDIVRTLSSWFAEKSVLYEKSKVLQLMLREVVLSQKMASSPVLKAWVRNENDPAARARAMAELADFRDFFRSRSYFFAIAESGNYYFDDGSGGDVSRPRYTLSPTIPKDGWFYATLSQVDDYQLNVDTDRVLQVTKVWVNTVLKHEGKSLAVIGTGVDLSDFIESVLNSAVPGVTNILFDANGAIQAHPDISVIDFASIAKERRLEAQSTVFNLMESPADRSAFRQSLERLAAGSAQTETLEVTIQGKHHIAGVAYIPEIKWFLATLTHPESAAGKRYTTAIAIAVVAALALTLLLAAIAFHYIVLRRLSALDTAARKIAMGDYAVELPRGANDELGRLAQSFREMSERVAHHTGDLEREVAQRTEVLERIAYADFLTGLLNRRGIIDRIQVEKNRLSRQGRKLGMLILDLDHFKQINDSYGHDLGDRALVQAANVIRGVMRSYDVCARWGGEEFLVIVTDVIGADDLLATAEKLRNAIKSSPVRSNGTEIVLTASIGACLADPDDNIDAMIKAADDALYAAKQGGRDRVVLAGDSSQSRPQADEAGEH
ncbi:MAG: diguanylate cyclase [Burkholderiales bacterium]